MFFFPHLFNVALTAKFSDETYRLFTSGIRTRTTVSVYRVTVLE